MTEQPKREAWDCLSQNQREAIVAAIDPGGFIQEFGTSYNRFALRDLIAGINVALSTQAAELAKVRGELETTKKYLDIAESQVADSNRERDALRDRVETVSELVGQMESEYELSQRALEANGRDTSNVELALDWCERLLALLNPHA